jgi:protease I
MTGKLEGKTVAIIVADEFEDVELLYPLLRLSEEGADILVVPVRGGLHTRPYLADKPVTGRFGTTVPIIVMGEGVRYTMGDIGELAAADVDCILFPGGYSPDALRLDQRVLELVRDCHAQGVIVSAICHGPWVLISAGIMRGKKATGYAATHDDLVNAGAELVDVPAIRDGNIITGRVPDDLPDFCLAIIAALSE